MTTQYFNLGGVSSKSYLLPSFILICMNSCCNNLFLKLFRCMIVSCVQIFETMFFFLRMERLVEVLFTMP